MLDDLLVTRPAQVMPDVRDLDRSLRSWEYVLDADSLLITHSVILSLLTRLEPWQKAWR